ncbi:MAG: TolC family protein [Candidatus Hydrogenedentota bacterium]|nr:MAG: TolC family protein [Candidatus Hydrogenedentota bacterium]
MSYKFFRGRMGGNFFIKGGTSMKKILIIFPLFFFQVSYFAKENANFNKTLTLEEAINIVIQKNLTLKRSAYDIFMADTPLKQYQKKYATNLELDTYYLKRKTPSNTNSSFFGDEFYEYAGTLSVSKVFSSGTFIQVGVKQSYSDSNDSAIPGIKPIPEPAYHKPAFFAVIRQELLKNAFGYQDRIREQALKNQAKITRTQLIDLLAQLVVSSLIDYWNVAIQKSALENAKKEYQATKRLQAIIARNARIGLSERFDVNQYRALTLRASSKVARTEQAYKEALRKLLRTINMPPDTKVSGVTDLTEELPDLNEQKALEAAFQKRADYKNALLELENAKLELKAAKNDALPSLQAYFQITSNSQDTEFFPAVKSAGGVEFPEYRAGIKMTYPLWDKDIRAKVRNGYLKIRQAKIKLEDLRSEVRDDVLNKLDRVKLNYRLLNEAKENLRQSELYYARLFQRARQGKFNAVAVKNALDAVVAARQAKLEALIQYNISLLQFDLAKNEIFERYHVDIDKLLAKVYQPEE